MIPHHHNDGGRTEAGYKGHAGDCAVRAIAIASGKPYAEVYEEVSAVNAATPRSKTRRKCKVAGRHSARDGVYSQSKVFKDYMRRIGFMWVPTMTIGSGTTVHLDAAELPRGRLVVRVTKHLAAVIDGVLHDTHDCSRDGTRAVYGYWIFQGEQR